MSYNYNDNSLIIGQIKEVLHDFNLPLLPVLTDDTRLRKGRCYIKDNKIVRCTEANYKTYKIKGIYCGEDLLNYELEDIGDYVYNRPILNTTKNLIINSSYYDNYTHEYLGDYLRFMRDYNKLNLMSMYNCFGKLTPKKIVNKYKIKTIDNKEFYFNIDTTDPGYNYYIVPVKFDKEYTVAIGSNIKYEIACIFYNDKLIDTPLELVKNTYKLIPGSKFNKPILFSTRCPDNLENCLSKENCLYMILKLPKEIDSSIVILEGNYCQYNNVIDGQLVSNFVYNEDKLPNDYISKLSLFKINNNKSYPFSDRLVEYILGNVITNIDDISTNIERVQDLVYPDVLKGYYGIWDDNLRNNIYKNYFNVDKTLLTNELTGNTLVIDGEDVNNKIRSIDIYNDLTGYVDRDTERILYAKDN